MRLLLDIGVGGTAARWLRQQGHDVSWLAEWQVDPGDFEILATAHTEQRTLITIDNDFGELAVVHRQPHFGIIRIARISARAQASAIAQALDRYGTELTDGAIVTVETGRVRIRPNDA